MINPFKEINWKPNQGEVKTFGKSLVIGGVVVASIGWISGFVFPSIQDKAHFFAILFSVIFLIGFTVIAIPRFCAPIYVAWYFFGACMATIISNLLLVLFYFLILTPIALLLRFTGHDPLLLKQPTGTTQWADHKQAGSLAQYYRQS